MKLQTGIIVSHSSAPQWGAGKVMEITQDKVAILFSDGETRKITASFLGALVPADPSTYLEPVKKVAAQRVKKTATTASKTRSSGQVLPRVISEELNFSYPKHLKKQFQLDTRGQIEAWQRDYPFLFDVRDASLANEYQGRTLSPHFLEWFAAIKIYETLGYYSLNQSYETIGHAAKQGLLRKMASEDAFRFMTTPHPVYGEGLCPELLLYRPDFSDWCFCTVRGPKDSLQPEQAYFWRELLAITGKKIMQVTIKEAA
jgi:hypothetical protein